MSADHSEDRKVFSLYDPVWVNENKPVSDTLRLVDERGVVVQVYDDDRYCVEFPDKRCSMVFSGSELSPRSNDEKVILVARKYQPVNTDGTLLIGPTEVCTKCAEELPAREFVTCPCGKRVCRDCGEKVSSRTNVCMLEGASDGN